MITEKLNHSDSKILVVGLNPALQKVLILDEFNYGEVNRVKEISYISGGKGANFAKASIIVNQPITLYQFSGGEVGSKYLNILDREKINNITQRSKAETRTCSTITNNENQEVTEIIEPSGVITKDESELLLSRIIDDMNHFSAIALCGTFPPGITGEFYAKIANTAKKLSIPLLMDASIEVEDILKEGVEIVKINLDELRSMTHSNNIDVAISAIFAKFNVKIIAITDGPSAAHLFIKKSKNNIIHYKYNIPKLENVINPIGAGDTVSAILLHEYIAGKSIDEAFKIALATGSASCLTRNNSNFDPIIAKELANNKITIKES